MTPEALSRLARQAATELGFDACGITHPGPSAYGEALTRWLSHGMHGEMRYMDRQAAKRRRPTLAAPGARSIVVVLHNYYWPECVGAAGYRVARYAQGDDYHHVMVTRLRELGRRLVEAAGTGWFKVFVDAGPLPERELASRAGLGWMAKNTMLIHPKLGSFMFVGCLATDLELARDTPFEADRCGTCTRCLDACPTAAFPEPRVLDATRCISYLTIEARSEPPSDLRAAIGEHLFGCDICQEVCPWNVRFARAAREAAYHPRPAGDWPTLEEIEAMDDRRFDEVFGGRALERARPAGLRRNARVVRENRR